MRGSAARTYRSTAETRPRDVRDAPPLVSRRGEPAWAEHDRHRTALRRRSTKWSAGSIATAARYEAQRCLSCGNCFECDGCYSACPEHAVIKLGPAAATSTTSTSAPAARSVTTSARVARSRWSPEPTRDAARGRRDRSGSRALAKRGRRHGDTAIKTLDGNEAAASIAYRVNEICAIYPDHALIDDGRAGRSVGVRRAKEHLGHGAARRRDAERGGRGGRGARRAADRRADDDVHRVAGPAPDDPEHVQDRRRADADGVSRGGPRRWPPRRSRSSAITPT